MSFPAAWSRSRFGLDYVRLRGPDGVTADVPVQRGRDTPEPDMPDGVEILSGLHSGDVLVHAMKLGISGRLTQATIRSPLTPLFLLAALAAGLIALLTIPREEDPQISVPMVDIIVSAERPEGAATRWNWSPSRWKPSSSRSPASSTSTARRRTTR